MICLDCIDNEVFSYIDLEPKNRRKETLNRVEGFSPVPVCIPIWYLLADKSTDPSPAPLKLGEDQPGACVCPLSFRVPEPEVLS